MHIPANMCAYALDLFNPMSKKGSLLCQTCSHPAHWLPRSRVFGTWNGQSVFLCGISQSNSSAQDLWAYRSPTPCTRTTVQKFRKTWIWKLKLLSIDLCQSVLTSAVNKPLQKVRKDFLMVWLAAMMSYQVMAAKTKPCCKTKFIVQQQGVARSSLWLCLRLTNKDIPPKISWLTWLCFGFFFQLWSKSVKLSFWVGCDASLAG